MLIYSWYCPNYLFYFILHAVTVKPLVSSFKPAWNWKSINSHLKGFKVRILIVGWCQISVWEADDIEQLRSNSHKPTQTASSRRHWYSCALWAKRELLFMPWFTLLFISCFSSLPAIIRIQTGPTCPTVKYRRLQSQQLSCEWHSVQRQFKNSHFYFYSACKCIWKRSLNSNCPRSVIQTKGEKGQTGFVFCVWLFMFREPQTFSVSWWATFVRMVVGGCFLSWSSLGLLVYFFHSLKAVHLLHCCHRRMPSSAALPSTHKWDQLSQLHCYRLPTESRARHAEEHETTTGTCSRTCSCMHDDKQIVGKLMINSASPWLRYIIDIHATVLGSRVCTCLPFLMFSTKQLSILISQSDS